MLCYWWIVSLAYQVPLVRNIFLLQHVPTDIRNHHVRTNCHLSLRGGGSVCEYAMQRMMRTLKTLRTLTRSRVQVATLSLSPFVRQNREDTFHLPSLTFFWIPITILRLYRFVSELVRVGIGCAVAHLVNSSIAVSTERLSSSDRLPFNPRLRAMHTSAQESPSNTQSSSLAISN